MKNQNVVNELKKSQRNGSFLSTLIKADKWIPKLNKLHNLQNAVYLAVQSVFM